ncbi:MAG: 2-C-methyl-D-erythritol 4-phosphate cytidylyltransferase [Coriobacteriia bacterium]|nr:2-C-methyl-D-erythritol 4-phosphate cytidylyltransferase [Coriobacteriia bacterium]
MSAAGRKATDVGHVRTAAVIVAGGNGERFGSASGKQLAVLLGRPMLGWTAEAFDAAPGVDLIVLVAHPGRVADYRAALDALGLQTPLVVTGGGETRQESVANGLAAVPGTAEIVLVHDGARPLVTSDLIGRLLETLETAPEAAGVVVGYPSVDTLKLVEGQRVLSTPDRARFWAVQTPQVFRLEALKVAFARASADGFLGTDDASLVERLGGLVLLFEGPRDNIKVTVPEDLALVEAILARRLERGGSRDADRDRV